MKTLLRSQVALLAGAMSLLAASAHAAALAASAAPAGEVLAPGNFIHVVVHIDKTMAFYHDVLGLSQASAGGSQPPSAKFAVNAPVAQLYAVPTDTPVDVVMYRLPGMGVALEFAEFRLAGQKSVHPRPQDPGAACMVLTVRQLDPILRRAHAAHVPIVSLGGVPVPSGDPAAPDHTVVLRDPDGYYVELVEPSAAGAARSGAGNAGNILQAALSIAIADTDRNAQFYRDLLGLPLQIDASFVPDASLAKTFGLRAGQVRHSVAMIDGSTFRYDFIEWKGVPRRATHGSVHDRGAGVLRFSVADVDGLVSNLKAQGIVADSTGGGTVSFGGTFHTSILSDPNGLYIEPVPRARARQSR